MPVVPPIPNMIKDPYTGAQTADPGNFVYTFPNNTTAVVGPNGELGAITPAKAQPNQNQTPADVMAKKGVYLGPNGAVYVDNPTPDDGRGPIILSTQSQQNQQLTDAKTVADTQYTNAQANKAQIDAQLASDPTNIQLQQQKTQADTAYQQALAAKTNADIAISQQTANATSLNAQSTAQNAASTAARVPSQNALESAQAGAATQNAQTALLNAQSTAARVGSQNALEAAQAQQAQANALGLTAKAAEPTVWQAGPTQKSITYYDPTTQSVRSMDNPAYQPTSPGQMTAQLKSQADAQWQQLQGLVAQGKLSADAATGQFERWWSDNVDPMKSDIATSQLQQQSALAQQAAMTNYYTMQPQYQRASLAQTASDAAQKNALAMMPYVVNKSALTTPGITTGARGFPQINPGQIMQNATFSLPNLQEIGRQGAAAALANYSPTAQAQLGQPSPPTQPPVGGMPGLAGMLNMSGYNFGPPPPQAAPVAAPAPAPVAPPPPAGGYATSQPGTYGPLAANPSWWGTYQPAA